MRVIFCLQILNVCLFVELGAFAAIFYLPIEADIFPINSVVCVCVYIYIYIYA